MILIYSCPSDALDLELSVMMKNWLQDLGVTSEWLVNCNDLGRVQWFDEELEIRAITSTEFKSICEEIKPNFLIIDGLPFGFNGESVELIGKIPTLWLARRLKWKEYLNFLSLSESALPNISSLALEPMSQEQTTFVEKGQFLELSYPILDAGPLPVSELDDDARRWLLLPSLDENQIAQQGGYAMELIEKEQKIPHLLDVAEFDPFCLPLYHLVSKYQRVIGGCSYAAACLALQWIGKDLKMGFRWVDQCDSWDDQTGRLACIRQRKWLKKDRTIDWQEWLKQQLKSGGVL